MTKKVLFKCAVFTVLLSASQFIYAGPPRVILKFSPQHLVRNGLWLSGEFFTSDYRLSHQFSAEGCYSEPYSTSGSKKFTGVTAEYSFRYYPNKMKRYTDPRDETRGMYLGFFCQGGSYTQTRTYPSIYATPKTELKGVTFFPGMVFGFQKRVGDKMFVDVFAGAGFHKVSITNSPAAYSRPETRYYGIYSSMILPKIGLMFGMGL